MKKLIGKGILGNTEIVEVQDGVDIVRVKRQFAKVGMALESYDRAIAREGNRLVNHPDDAPEYDFNVRTHVVEVNTGE